jgi:hypothetical protein
VTVGLRQAREVFRGANDEEQRRGAVSHFELEANELEAEALQFLVEAMGDDSWRVRKEAVARAPAGPIAPAPPRR